MGAGDLDDRVVRVAIFTDNDFDKINGVTTSLKAALRHAPPNVRLRIYTAADAGLDTPDYLSLRSPGVGLPFYREMRMHVPRLRAFLDAARSDGVDLVHLTTPGPVGLAALFVRKRLGLNMVGTFHTDLATYTRVLSGSPRLGRLMQEYLRWPYGKCDQILVPSEATRRQLVASKIDAGKLRLFRRGVDTTVFSPARRSVALRERWGASDVRPAILYAGRVSREKGLGALPAFQSLLRVHGVPHRLIVVGDGPMRAELGARCTDAIFTGSLAHDEVAIAMASADVFLFPSETDSAGNVVLEAQASGLPVIVTKHGGPSEYVVPDVTGVVCDRGQPVDLARPATALLREQARRREMARAASAHARTLQWETALEPLYVAYQEVASLRSASCPAMPGLAAARQR